MPGLPPMTIPAEKSVHGLEKNIWAYVAHEVLVFREVRRVLADYGVLFLNLGDSYTSGGRSTHGTRIGYKQETNAGCLPMQHLRPELPSGLKPKDLCEIPSKVVLALQSDGWWLRSRCPWLKKNSMPESCTDRPASSLEYVFVLTKSERYYWDAQAVKQPLADGSVTRLSETTFDEQTGGPKDYGHRTAANRSARKAMCNLKERLIAQEKWGDKQEGWKNRDPSLGRNLRNSDWFFDSWQGFLMDGDGGPLAFIVNPQASGDNHFAQFPPKLVEPMILAGCPKKVCAVCGKPRERIVEKNRVATRPGENTKIKTIGANSRMRIDRDPAHADRANHNRDDEWDTSVVGNRDPERHVTETQTVGWTDCGCGQGFRPGRVIDPFGGSGTVGYVAAKLKQDWVLIEMNENYVRDIATAKIQEAELGLPVKESRNGQLALFSSQNG